MSILEILKRLVRTNEDPPQQQPKPKLTKEQKKEQKRLDRIEAP
jgi:hypothetical protein